MSGDARTTAWLAAWNRIEAATQLRDDYRRGEGPFKGSHDVVEFMEPLPPDYHALMGEAAVFAELAKAEPRIGIDAHDWLDRMYEENEARKEQINEFMKKRKEADDANLS